MESLLSNNINQVSQRQQELEILVPQKSTELQKEGAWHTAMQGNPHLAKQYVALGKEITTLSAEVRALRREQSENIALLQGLNRRLELIRAGNQDNPRAHIHDLAVPDDPTLVLRFDRAAETWAAVSLSLLLFVVASLIFFAPGYLWASLVVILILFVVLESILRGAFVPTVGRITLILAMIATVILFIHFWKAIIVVALLTMGISLMYHRLRELAG
jgi:uncharacterized membrane protein